MHLHSCDISIYDFTSCNSSNFSHNKISLTSAWPVTSSEIIGLISPLSRAFISSINSNITEYVLISTPSSFAFCFTTPVGLTLKPRIIACSLAFASWISLSVIPPTPPWIIFTLTSSFFNSAKVALIASREPWTSVLIITGRLLLGFLLR